MKKNVLILFVLIYSISLNAQKLGIEVLKRNYNYVISDTLTNIGTWLLFSDGLKLEY